MFQLDANFIEAVVNGFSVTQFKRLRAIFETLEPG
jgi:hypothetical protein